MFARAHVDVVPSNGVTVEAGGALDVEVGVSAISRTGSAVPISDTVARAVSR